MAYQAVEPIGVNSFTDVDTTQRFPFGFRARAKDPANVYQGEAEFVYVKGVTSGAAGLAVIYNDYTGVTALTAARSKGKIGILQAALDASTKFGWVQVRGAAPAQVAGTVVAGSTVYLTATSGKVDDAVVAGDIVYGANFATADATPTANWAVLSLSYPYAGDTDAA